METFFEKCDFFPQKVWRFPEVALPLHPLLKRSADCSGCSSARLEYASGGRGVASSNLVIPTIKEEKWRLDMFQTLFFFFVRNKLPKSLAERQKRRIFVIENHAGTALKHLAGEMKTKNSLFNHN